MSSDYDNTRTRRRKPAVKYNTKRKTKVIFRLCLKCGYDWAQQIYVDESPNELCPKCGSPSVEN